MLETRAVWPLEIRISGRTLSGSFRYGQTATMSDRGRVRKERFDPGAFRFAVEDEAREIHLLRGHSFDEPLASRRGGSLALEDGEDALTFRATLPEPDAQPTYMRDTVRMVESGLLVGVSPGFRVPPRDVVPDAETLEAEIGNPGVQIRVIRAAVLFELSLVSRPAYDGTEVDVRSMFGDLTVQRRRWRTWL